MYRIVPLEIGDISCCKPKKQRTLCGRLRHKDREKQSVYLQQEILQTEAVVNCVGILVQADDSLEKFPGTEHFEVLVIHSGRWVTEEGLAGKNVTVVFGESSSAKFISLEGRDASQSQSRTRFECTLLLAS